MTMTVNQAIELEAKYDRAFKDESAMYTRVALEAIQTFASNTDKVRSSDIQRAISLKERGIVQSETKYRDKVRELETAVGLPFHKWKRL